MQRYYFLATDPMTMIFRYSQENNWYQFDTDTLIYKCNSQTTATNSI